MGLYVLFEEGSKPAFNGEVERKGVWGKGIEVESASFSFEKPGEGLTGSARRRGSVKYNDVAITKNFDKSSTGIAKALATGQVFGSIKIMFTASFTDNSADGSVEDLYLELALKQVSVTNYSISGDPDETPKEEFSLNYEHLEWKYTPKTAAGAKQAVGTWNVDLVTGIAQG